MIYIYKIDINVYLYFYFFSFICGNINYFINIKSLYVLNQKTLEVAQAMEHILPQNEDSVMSMCLHPKVSWLFIYLFSLKKKKIYII